MEYNQIIQGDSLAVLKTLSDESVNCCVTSPPYWGLRDYGIEPVIWDGDGDCKHEWGNKTIILKHKSGETNPGKESWFKDRGASDDKGNRFCIKCGAWKGSLGLEPDFELYIKHLCDIFDEVKRVLRKDGTCWVNLGDTYWGGGNNRGSSEDNLSAKQFSNRGARGQVQNQWTKDYSAKSLCLIPQRFAIEMVNRGWILRNTIIWHKPNCMPSSANDRFTVDFEYLFYFTKNNKAIFWTNEKTLECVDKKPLGIKGIEGIDWEWKNIGENYSNCDTKIDNGISESLSSPRARKYRNKKLKKVSLWTGHDYWFEQQFEPIAEATIKRSKNKFYPNNPKTKLWYSTQKAIKPGRDAQTFNQEVYKKIANGEKTTANKRCVWKIPTQPFPEAHFAVYPEKLIEVPIKAGCPEFLCKRCGMARVKIIDNSERVNTRPGLDTGNMKSGKDIDPNKELHKSDLSKYRQQIKYKKLGYTDCSCKNPEYEGGIVLDPFIGAGTTAVVAKKQGKRYLGIELKQEYIDMANKRIRRIPETLF